MGRQKRAANTKGPMGKTHTNAKGSGRGKAREVAPHSSRQNQVHLPTQKHLDIRGDARQHIEQLASRSVALYLRQQHIGPLHPDASDTYRFPLTNRWNLPEIANRVSGHAATHLEVHLSVENGGWEWEMELAWMSPSSSSDKGGELSRTPWAKIACTGVRADCYHWAPTSGESSSDLDSRVLGFVTAALYAAGYRAQARSSQRVV